MALKLMIPGPVSVEDDVLFQMGQPVRPHYGAEWTADYNETRDLLKQVFKTEGDVHILSGSGTAAIDAAIGSLHVTQGSATGGQACLGLQQKDVSEPFTRYVGDSHAADASLSLVDAAALTTPSARFAYIKVYIQDDANNITDQVGYIGVELAPTA